MEIGLLCITRTLLQREKLDRSDQYSWGKSNTFTLTALSDYMAGQMEFGAGISQSQGIGEAAHRLFQFLHWARAEEDLDGKQESY